MYYLPVAMKETIKPHVSTEGFSERAEACPCEIPVTGKFNEIPGANGQGRTVEEAKRKKWTNN